MNMDAREMSAIRDTAIALAKGTPLEGFDFSADPVLAAEGGSDRRFIRLGNGERSAVVLSQPGGGWELDSYVEIGRFLLRYGIPVPEIYAHDGERGIVLMEDLGAMHLESALRTASAAETEDLYRRALGVLADLETAVTAAMRREGLLAQRAFDRATLLGETDYFRREFIEGFCPVPVPGAWEKERVYLADTLAREEPVFMHRDFQCRNIMIKNGRLRIIDFQTAYRGPGLYDAASLLKDPYHPLPAAARGPLLEEFHAKLRDRGARRDESFETFHAAFTTAGIQRNLQALAAFAKLGLRKGKRKFLDSIPNGLDLLEEGVRESGRFPGIEAMVRAIRERSDGFSAKGS